MSRFRHRPPSDVAALLDLAPGDHVLAGAHLTGGGWAVASVQALHLTHDDGIDPASTPWSDVDRGSLDPATRTLTVWWVSGARRGLVLPEDADGQTFARVFRDRVQQSVVHAVSVPLPGGGAARVALRRGADGALFTQAIGEGATDLADPGVVAALAKAEAAVREAAGLAG